MYVDNLILTSNTIEEATTMHRSSKKIFQDLQTNLREFTSNSNHLMEKMEKKDKSKQQQPKVLAIKWNEKSDQFRVHCKFPESTLITKRFVTSSTTAIYDPMGWLVPLLHPPKRKQYEWDTKLTAEDEAVWRAIVNNMNKFERNIPRFLAPKKSKVTLITFADTSISTMSACTYIHHQDAMNLLMAKTKLPSIRGKSRIPKVELNAITLAMRLTNSVPSQLQKVLEFEGMYVFSDSEIVLKWLKFKPESETGPFIQNRLLEIHNIVSHLQQQQLTMKFGYIASSDNPADCVTRRLLKGELLNHFWWADPSMLQCSQAVWSQKVGIFTINENDNNDDQANEILILGNAKDQEMDRDLVKPSQAQTWTKAKRILAFAIRVIVGTARILNTNAINKIVLSIDINQPLNTEWLTGPEIELSAKLLILSGIIKAARHDPAVMREKSGREIDWKTITLYAPWQGGFYERLIKSVEHSLHNTLGKPIDFIQKDLLLHYPMGYNSDQSKEDPSYLPSAEMTAMATRRQAAAALESYCKFTKTFWKIWKN
ncbi:Pao retrotransposon peptidase [Oesophagostomum dentatum]|uniref:Pao retrotransposon peptidase n=1 Tax=Oesophagostomum dentatum TaxID=61180 RepID=A0A0B1ST20_OESDE|nr:Pao retrotransposon peptidase [Oesophagostomum dentatum]